MDDPTKKEHAHDTHAMPPQVLCNEYKKYQKIDDAALATDMNIVDFNRGLTEEQKERIIPAGTISSAVIGAAQKAFLGQKNDEDSSTVSAPKECTIYEHKDFAGLRLFPSLLPPECQVIFLDKLLHRELSNPLHITNIHQDYEIPFPPTQEGNEDPDSFFKYPQSGKNQMFMPRNPHSIDKPLNMAQFLQKKLRWLTIGNQYNWNTRSYPTTSPTPFPADIARLVTTLFTSSFNPESGVVLLYSTKDYMPVHRDVSEECQRGLASFSLGCDGLFIIARDRHPNADPDDEDREQEMVTIRVRSGDVVQMDGETRWSWHAMPKVIAGTCPEWLDEWPKVEGGPKEYEKWRGFMRGKRLNISCRQVWAD